MADQKPLQDGIYVVKPGEWLTVDGGKQQTWKAPDYDLHYLLRAYRGRIPFRGELDGERQPRRPTTAELTEHVPKELQGVYAAAHLGELVGEPSDPHKYDGLFTWPFAFPGYDADGNRIKVTNPTLDSAALARIDALFARVDKVLKDAGFKKTPEGWKKGE